MTLKEKLLEAGIYEGFIRQMEDDYIRLHSSGIEPEEYKEYLRKCERFTNQCMSRLYNDVDKENNPNI